MSKPVTTGTVSWQSPANIALVKYWGKHGYQLPQNPSVSITLSESVTTTTVQWKRSGGNRQISFLFEGKPHPKFELRVTNFLNKILPFMPSLGDLSLDISSSNSFPHSSGISSSASFMSSLALCLTDIDQVLTGITTAESEFFRKASHLARLGSGSAARSVYGGFVHWGYSEAVHGSSDEFAIPVNHLIHNAFNNYCDAVLVVSSKPKPLSSSAGHALMDQNPFSSARYQSAKSNIEKMFGILATGDQEAFISLVEQEALTLHGLILASEGGKILMEPNTLAIIREIRDFRAVTGSHLAFTLDAGPNVHLLYPGNEADRVKEFIALKLAPLCEGGRWIDDAAGNGPKRLKNEYA
jgi:diphosphomevalonate decarboxylase